MLPKLLLQIARHHPLTTPHRIELTFVCAWRRPANSDEQLFYYWSWPLYFQTHSFCTTSKYVWYHWLFSHLRHRWLNSSICVCLKLIIKGVFGDPIDARAYRFAFGWRRNRNGWKTWTVKRLEQTKLFTIDVIIERFFLVWVSHSPLSTDATPLPGRSAPSSPCSLQLTPNRPVEKSILLHELFVICLARPLICGWH